MGRLKLSIALATHNRERFLAGQLESIAAQRRLPDELVIGDDCSTDRSVEIIRRFAARAPFPVRWYVNGLNRGCSHNFESVIERCSGDLVIFCDDDDVCLPDKLKVTESEFLDSPEAGLMMSNSTLVDEGLTPLGVTLWDAAKLTLRSRNALRDPISTLAKHFVGAGHVLAFRTHLKRYILPFPREFPPLVFFDVWITFVLASIVKIICNPQSLVLHRLHEGQIVGVESLASEKRKEQRSHERKRIASLTPLVEEVIRRVSSISDAPLGKTHLRSLVAWAALMKMQSELPSKKSERLIPIARSILTGHYHRYSRGFLTAARDLLILR